MNSNDIAEIKDELKAIRELLEERLPAKKNTPGKSHYENNPVDSI